MIPSRYRPRRAAVFVPLAALAAAVLAADPAARSLAADPPELPSDLALVPPDALGFAHLKVGAIWKSDAMAEYRSILEKAGPKVLETLNAQFAPAPLSLETATGILLPPNQPHEQPRAYLVLRFSEAFDPARVLAGSMPEAKPAKAGGKGYYADEQQNVAVWFPDNKTMVLNDPKDMAALLARPAAAPDADLAKALAAAATGPVLTAAVNVRRLPIPPQAADGLPPEFRPLLKTGMVTLTAGGKEPQLDLRAAYATEADAADGEKALRQAANLGRAALGQARMQAERRLTGRGGDAGPRSLEDLPEAVGSAFALGYLKVLDEMLSNPPIARQGSALAVNVPLPDAMGNNSATVPVLIGLLLPAVQKVREAAARTQSQNNLKQIAIAMHNYHDTYGFMPPAAIASKAGKPLLSWRVAILPYIEQDALYRQFKLDEPWDSDHNKKLIPLMPKIYADPRAAAEPGQTFYKVIVGNGAGFEWTKGRKMQQITDGTSNTIMTAVGGDPVIWTKPDDFEFDPNKQLPNLRGPFPLLLVGMFDGSVRTVMATVDEKALKAAITINGGEVFDW